MLSSQRIGNVSRARVELKAIKQKIGYKIRARVDTGTSTRRGGLESGTKEDERKEVGGVKIYLL